MKQVEREKDGFKDKSSELEKRLDSETSARVLEEAKKKHEDASQELCERLNCELQKQTTLFAELEESRKKLDEKEKCWSTIEGANKKLEANMKDLQTHLYEETNEKDVAINNSKKLQTELTTLQATVAEANNNISCLTSIKTKLEAELKEAKSEAEELIAAKAGLESKLEGVKERLVEEQQVKSAVEEAIIKKDQEIVGVKRQLVDANEKIVNLEKEKNTLEARLQDAFFTFKEYEERLDSEKAKKKLQAQQHREYLKSLKSPFSTVDHKLSVGSREMKRDQNQHLMICNWSDSSVVEWDPQTSRTINSVKLDSNPNSIAIDSEGNQWIVCEDYTVRKRQREDQEFVIQFTLDRSTKIYRIAVTKKGKEVIIQNNEKDQIEIWEQTIATTSDGWFWNTTTTTQKKWKQTRCISSPFGSKFNIMGQIVVDSRDRIIVCDSNNNRVVVLTDELKDVIDISTRFKFDGPFGVAVDEMDNIFVAERKTKRVVVFDCEGNHLNTFNHSLDSVFYLAVVNDSIYVKDLYEALMQELKLK